MVSDADHEAIQRRRIFLHFLNPEILRLYSETRHTGGPEQYQKVLRLTKYCLLLSEGPLIIPAASLFEIKFIDSFLKALKPIRDSNLLYLSSPTPDLGEYAEKKRWEYRDQLPSFPRYLRTEYSQKSKLVKDLLWIPRVRRSASRDISHVWDMSLHDESAFWTELLSSPELRVTSLTKLERAIESIPERLEGRAFIYEHVASLLPVHPQPRLASQVNLLISRGYLESYLEEFDAIALVDTPLGLLDCGLSRHNSKGRLRTLSFRDIAATLSSLNIKVFIDSLLSWPDLIKLREHFVFSWLIGQVVTNSLLAERPLERAVRISRFKQTIEPWSLRQGRPLQALYNHLDRIYGEIGPYLDDGTLIRGDAVDIDHIGQPPHGKRHNRQASSGQLDLLACEVKSQQLKLASKSHDFTRKMDHVGSSPLTEKVRMRSKARNILFMDVAGWSKLQTLEIQSYVSNAMPKIKPLLRDAEIINTWGDAIVATFDSAADAAECALSIRDFFKRSVPTDGISTGLTCRISLHLGEVLQCTNPITDRLDIFGSAVHLAARLEPATEPGQVFCSEAFANALKEVSGITAKAEFLEERDFPKGYGKHRIYAVTWHNEPSQLGKPA